MKPPVCCVCDRRLETGEGGLVAFADYEALPGGLVGHPSGLEWFCPEHLEAGRALQHWKRDPAVAKLRGTGPVKYVPAPKLGEGTSDPTLTPLAGRGRKFS